MTTPTPREALAELVAAQDQARTLTEDSELIVWSGRMDRAWETARASLAVPSGCLAEVQPIPEQTQSEQPQDHLADGNGQPVLGDAGRAAVTDAGPWFAQRWPDRQVVIQSDQFEHDVALIVNGDFTDDDQRMKYAEGLAAQFNGRPAAWWPMQSAPKDEHILAVVDGIVRIVKWGKTSHVPMYGFCLADQGAEDFDLCEPTAWQRFPDPLTA